MRWIAMLLGLACGGANFALLAAAAKALAAGRKRALLLLPAGAAPLVAGLVLCALTFPRLLPWFGFAGAGALILPAIAYFVWKKK